MKRRWLESRNVAALIRAVVIGMVLCGVDSALGQYPPPFPPSGYGPPPGYGSDPYAHSVNQSGWFPGGVPIVGTGPMSVADRLWVRAEYLYWATEGMDIPALVTSSPAGTPQAEAGILGFPRTSVLLGNEEINDGGASGIRTRAGFWLTPQGTFAIEGEYFQFLEDHNETFTASGNGAPILARPFFDVSRGLETAQLVSFPNRVSGNIGVGADSDLRSFLINGRIALCPIGVCNANGESDRVDWIIGYRYIELDDRLGIAESLSSEVLNTPGTITLGDTFRTSNEFNGLQLGVIHEAKFRRVRLESMLRVAVGTNSQTVNIQGQTAITENGETENFSGGLLAQRTNIGNYQRDQFTMIPEVGFTLGFQVFDWLDATVGYTVLYLPNVVRAGDQVDLDVNSNLLAPEDPLVTNGLRPQFDFVQDDYWAHGLTLGAELRF